jgi:hypothetical protein
MAPVRFPAHQQRSYVKNRGATVEEKGVTTDFARRSIATGS